MEVNPGVFWCMDLDGRQFCSMEFNSGVCLVHLIIWSAVLVCGGQSGCRFGEFNYMAAVYVYGGQIGCILGHGVIC